MADTASSVPTVSVLVGDMMIGKVTRKSLRLKNFDYSSNGKYFITICTYNKENYFGYIDSGKMHLSSYGKIAEEEIINVNIRRESQYIEIEKYIVMPNHIHMFIQISNEDWFHNYQKEAFSKPTSKSIPSVVRSYKSAVSKRIHETYNSPLTPYNIWQPRYYDNIIRNEKAYQKIWDYIDSNPLCWEKDKFYKI